MPTQIFHFSNTGISSGQRFYLKDDVSGIFVRDLNINSNFPIVASNLVYNTGSQYISGTKLFVGALGLGDASHPSNNKLFFYDTGLALGGGGYTTIKSFSKDDDTSIIFEFSDQGANAIYLDILAKTISGNNNSTINFPNNIGVSGTGIFNALDLNNIDNLSLSGVDITITSGSVNINTSLNINGISVNPYQPEFPAWTGIRRYSPLALESVSSSTPISGSIAYFPFLIKKNVTNPVACVEMTNYSTHDPKINIGIYSGHYGFENARLITSGSITGNINYTGIYRTTLNGNFSQGPYILASVLESGQGSSFRIAASQGIREHIGINTGNLTLHGVTSTVETNTITESDINNNLKINIGTGTFVTSSVGLGPIVFLEY